MKTKIGTRLRITPGIESAVIKTYLTSDIELEKIDKIVLEDGIWYKVKDNMVEGWVRFDFLKIE